MDIPTALHKLLDATYNGTIIYEISYIMGQIRMS